MFSKTLLPVVLIIALVKGVAAGAEEPRYDTPLRASITGVEQSALNAPQNQDLAASLKRGRALAAEVPGQQAAPLTTRMLAAPESSVLRIRIQFEDLPQRALAPRLLANDRVIGHPVGELKRVKGGVEAEFLVLPQMVGNFYFDANAPVILAVQMGEDQRTRTPLSSPETVEALREALGRN